MRRVQAVTWNWRGDDVEASRLRARRERTELRRAAVVQAVVTAVIAGVILAIGHDTFAVVLWVLAALVLALGLLAPHAYRPVRRFGEALGRWVGTGLSYLLLVPLFYLFFTPGAVVLRLLGHDPLDRRGKAPGLSLWIHRRSKDPRDNVTDQFHREDRRDRAAERPVGSLGDRWPGSAS